MKYKGVRLKFHKIFFALTVNYANRTVFDVFEKLFLSAYKQLLPKTVLNSKIPFTFLMTLILKSTWAAPKFPKKYSLHYHKDIYSEKYRRRAKFP